MSTISLTVLGGGNEIGANSFLIEQDGHGVLLDCGIHPKKEGTEALPAFDLLRRPPDAAIVSHAHIDHCGSLPYFARQFPRTECYATEPTVRVMDRMLHNSVSVMGTLALERGIREYPLYTHVDVDELIRRCYGMQLDEEFALTWDSPWRATLLHAGHVLGSACILLKASGHTIFYSGDLCATNQELMGGMRPLNGHFEVDTLIIESTRGAHEDAHQIRYEEEIGRFGREVARVLKRNGTVLIPSFALGRTQELLNVIARLQEWGRVPDVPVYASGLGRAVYEIYMRYPHYLRPGATVRPLYDFKRIGDVWERSVTRELLKRPCIVVATSGMMIENTPSSVIAQEMVREDKHGIFFVGYLDPDTLGHKVLHAQSGESMSFELGGRPVPISLENRQQFSFSAHASREDLRAVVEHLKPRNVVFVHGDEDAIEWMASHCRGDFRRYTPGLGETIALDA